MVEWENDKPTVVALREIADELIGRDILVASAQESVDEPLLSEEEALEETT